MGLNLYAVKEEDCCNTCGHKKNLVHLGKFAGKGAFIGEASGRIRSLKQMEKFVRSERMHIFDDEGNFWPLEAFLEEVYKRRSKAWGIQDDLEFFDEEGIKFLEGQFS